MSNFNDNIRNIQLASRGEEVRDSIVSALQELLRLIVNEEPSVVVPEQTVDTELDDESTNPVQNKVVTEAIMTIQNELNDSMISTVDTELDTESDNAIANSAVTTEINSLNSSISNDISQINTRLALLSSKVNQFKYSRLGELETAFDSFKTTINGYYQTTLTRVGELEDAISELVDGNELEY